MTSPSRDDWDAEDTRLRESAGDLEGLLARYVETIDGRCRAKIWNEYDAQDVAQRVLFRLWKELTSGKRYRAPFRVVVHQVIGWTIKGYFGAPAEPDPLDDRDAPTGGGLAEIRSALRLIACSQNSPRKSGASACCATSRASISQRSQRARV